MIQIYNTKGEYIATETSQYKAAKRTKQSQGNISRCVNGNLDQSGDFVFVETTKSSKEIIKILGDLIFNYFISKRSNLPEFLNVNCEEFGVKIRE